MTIGQKLKQLRSEKGLTQKDLADQLHVSFQTVSKWENDENEPDISTLRELSKLYDCSVDYLISEDENEQPKEEPKLEPSPTPVVAPVEQITKTIIIHQKELHVCRGCGKDIPEDDLAIEPLTKKERFGRGYRDVPAGEAYYHKACWDAVIKRREEERKKNEAARISRAKKMSFGWGIAGGAIAFIIALLVMLFAAKNVIHPVVAVLLSVLAGYLIFAMIYCILSGSYIGDVFAWCAGLSIKFPGLIFSWDIEGFIWVITMKITFAVLGFIIGLFALAFAIVFSSALGGISFPFILIHNINNNYADAF